MYLDETILQTSTAARLIEFIDELYEGKKHWSADVDIKYREIKRQGEKALKKRKTPSFNCLIVISPLLPSDFKGLCFFI